MLELRNIKKDYITSSETVSALKGLDITFRDREFVSILGPSGCGKTTLLNIIGGLDKYTSGDLIINGRSTKSFKDRDWDVYRNHRVGFIFQCYNLIPHQTILGNVELALTIAGIEKEERVERAKRALDRVGLSGQYYKRPNQLSGGQCQRVAIARALVNDPEILLADEPTGALDTVTSVQIMDLIREIAGERLVIMVTHNPELAEQYSTRIVKLLDGRLLDDSNPVTGEELDAYAAAMAEIPAPEEKPVDKGSKKPSKESAKMSFFTAFRLSARNLASKKGRTTMIGFAGSIGIIGIAMVLAFSAGIKGYIAAMQDDMLSGNPITITETTYDLNALTGMMDAVEKEDFPKEINKAYINSLIEYMATMQNVSESMIIKNDINKNYFEYVKNMPKEYYNAMKFDYGMDTTYSIYTDITTGFGEDKDAESPSIAALTEKYTAILNGTKFSQYASFVTTIVPSFEQAPNNPDYIASQYEVHGKIAENYDEVMLVITKDQEISDLLLARLGYYTEEQFYNLIYKVSEDENKDQDPRYDPSLDLTELSYDELMNKTFTWYPNDAIYEKKTDITGMSPFRYNSDAGEIADKSSGVTLKVVGVLIADENTTYGCLSSGIYYTEALTEYMLEKNLNSEIVEYVKGTDTQTLTSMTYNGMSMGIYYDYSYLPFDSDPGDEKTWATAFVGSSLGLESIMSAFGGSSSGSTGSSSSSGLDLSAMKTIDLRFLGGNDIPNAMSIYPVSFDEKGKVTKYLDGWNKDETISFTDSEGNLITLTEEQRSDITYTDVLELIIDMINTMIQVVTYALVAFTSISLVVSTVMIGIITYVSVVERIKEIGVIRSLGGRKRDVSNLFIAETFILGLLAGLIGVGFTYAASVVVNLILKPIIGYSSIAALPVSDAVTLVILSIVLTLISGLLPARSAAKKDPVVALRTE